MYLQTLPILEKSFHPNDMFLSETLSYAVLSESAQSSTWTDGVR